jgi:fluoride exporter
MEFMWVGIGGFVGANTRNYAEKLISHWLGTAFPYGTFIVNITGAFIIGIIATYLGEKYLDDPYLKQLLVVGFLGGYTTFSSYSLDAIKLFEDGKWQQALLYIVGSNGLGILACFAGVLLTRRLILG